MKITKKLASILGALITSLHYASPTVDLPLFYRTPFFQGEIQHKETAWATKFIVRYGQGETWNCMDRNSKTKPLLNVAGPLDITRLGLGTRINPERQPVTDQYWQYNNSTHSVTFNEQPLPTPHSNDGKLDLKGKFSVQDLGFELTQNAKHGFFGQIYVPIRSVKINHISFKNKGAATVNDVDINTFMHNDFNTILAEHHMHHFSTPFEKSGLSDITVSAGWQGYTNIGSQWIMNLGGSMEAGVLLPVAGKLDSHYVAAIPLGYNYSVGAFARLKGEINVLNWIGVGMYGDSILFFDQKQTLQMRTYDAHKSTGDLQSGWLRLGKGFATLNAGSLWDCGAYIRIKPFLPGLSFFGGYSYTRQEATHVTVKDDDFSVLVTVIPPNEPKGPAVLYPSKCHGDQNTVVKTDPRFHAWVIQTIHAGASLEIGKDDAKISPRIQVEYSYPFDAVLSFKTPIAGGSLGVHVSFNF